MTDKQLELVKKKDRKAQQAFYCEFSPRMFRLAYRYVSNEQDAGSIVNMGFFKIFNHIQEVVYQSEISLQAWMKKIVINEALMFLRQRFPIKEPVNNLTEELNLENISGDNLVVEDYYKLIRRLPDDLRTVFNLYAIDGYTHKEIALQLNIHESSSRVYLSRARKLLQEYLSKY